jgi:hypothetical protein
MYYQLILLALFLICMVGFTIYKSPSPVTPVIIALVGLGVLIEKWWSDRKK